MASTPWFSIQLQHLARIGRELKLQQLLPHLLLRAAQIGDVVERTCPGRARSQRRKSRSSSRVSRIWCRGRGSCRDRPAGRRPEARGERVVQPGERVGLAMDGGDGPDAPGGMQHGEFVAVPGSRGDRPTAASSAASRHAACPRQPRASRPMQRVYAAFSSCSSFCVAGCSSMDSTAASSRTSRSSAAW